MYASICTGGSQLLTITGGDSYQWSRDGAVITGATASTYTATQAGTYSVIITRGQCSAPASNVVEVTVAPVPNGSISPANASICTGGSQLLTATGGDSYQWSRDGSVITGATNATYTATQAGTYSVVITSGTCSGPASNNAVITTATAPSGSISPATASICTGGSQLLTATGGDSYQWSLNGTAISGATNATYTATQPGTYSVMITTGTCSGPASNDAEITTASAPSGSISPATASICTVGSQLLTATGGDSYQWSRDGSVITGATNATYTATQPGTYSVVITSGTCSGPASNNAVITTASAPSGTLSPATASICTGGSQLLTATGGDSYQWSRDGSVITGATNATYTATQAGTYSVMIISGTCSGPASNTSVITLASAPPGIQYSSIQVQKDRPFTLSARNIGTKYNWSPPDDLDNPRSSTPVVKTSQDRSYNIAITLDNGCTVTDTLNVQIAKGSNVFVPGAFTPDKNGFNDILRPLAVNIRMNYFRIYNRWGQLIYETKVAGEGWNGEFKGLLQPVGVYLWIFEGTDTDGKIFKSTGTTILIK